MKIWRILVVLNVALAAIMAEEKSCVCPAVWQPVCASNGKTYANSCYFNIEKEEGSQEIIYNGSCEAHKCLQRCPHTPLNVCGSDGLTYGSKCALGCTKIDQPEKADVTVAYNGKCKEPCICYELYKPVCGSNGETYGNECFFNCDNDGSLRIVYYNGTCEAYNCFRKCPHKPLTVCGSDGVTYESACALRCSKVDNPANVTVAYKGECNYCMEA